MKKTIITALALAFGMNVFAATQPSSRSENAQVFVATDKLNKTIRQGLIQRIAKSSERSKSALASLLEKAQSAGFQSRVESVSIYGGKKLVVTLLSTPSHIIELEADHLPLAPSTPSSNYQITVISKSNIFDVDVVVDNLAMTSLNLSGQVAKDFQASLLKMGLTADSNGVVSLFGAFTIYHLSPGSGIDSDVMCGDLNAQRALTCTIYNNIK